MKTLDPEYDFLFTFNPHESEADQKTTIDWFKSRPEKIQAAIRKFPLGVCLRGLKEDGHYTIYSYQEPIDKDKPVTLKTVHGHDSFGAGSMVFGVPLDDVRICGCGEWEPPTEEDVEKCNREAEAFRKFRNKSKKHKHR